MYNVLLFCDPGIDDSLALMYALLNPKINVVGIVTGYGNVPQQQATQNVAYLLHLSGRDDVSIISGAKSPLSGEIAIYYPEIHGEEGLGPIRPPEDFQREVVNFDEIFKIMDAYANDLVIVDLGRSTSLAIAYLLGGEEYLRKVEAVYCMGGAFLVPGNVTPVAEANFHGDAIAANLVLNKLKNVFITPLNVTNHAIITPETIQAVTSYRFNAFTHLIKPIFDYYNKAYKKLNLTHAGSPLHDLFTLFALVNPEQVQYINRQASVSINFDDTKGESIADFRAKSSEQVTENTDHIAISFKYDAFVRDFTTVMSTRYL